MKVWKIIGSCETLIEKVKKKWGKHKKKQETEENGKEKRSQGCCRVNHNLWKWSKEFQGLNLNNVHFNIEAKYLHSPQYLYNL